MTGAVDIKTLRDCLLWTQEQMAQFLGLDRSSVSRIVGKGRESGPVAALLDGLSAALADGRVSNGVDPMAARAVVLSLPPNFQRGDAS
jgi:transcriptional regulator with XRE-family HTH domain